jgi:hypothetical protein
MPHQQKIADKAICISIYYRFVNLNNTSEQVQRLAPVYLIYWVITRVLLRDLGEFFINYESMWWLLEMVGHYTVE